MKILYIITDLGLGGAEVLLVNLANRMVKDGHEVEILALGAINAHVQSLDARIPVHMLHMTKNFLGMLRAYRACWRLSRTKKRKPSLGKISSASFSNFPICSARSCMASANR